MYKVLGLIVMLEFICEEHERTCIENCLQKLSINLCTGLAGTENLKYLVALRDMYKTFAHHDYAGNYLGEELMR
jgi:hypothetical protein